uniref:Sodium:neurotransmitter symporter domain containing protein n=1 Tax=Haemonchus contortus TaxID=6289 RepID=A0A7I4YFQ1_HAECO
MEKGKSAKEVTAISSSKRPSASDTGSDTTSKPRSLVEDVTGGSSTTARSKTVSVARTTPSSIARSKPRSGKTVTAKSPMHRKSSSTKSPRHGKSKSSKSKKSIMKKVLSRSLGLSPARSIAHSRPSSTPKSPSSRLATLMQDVIETQDIESIFEATTVYKPAVPLESFRKSATDAIVIVALLCSTDTLFSFPIEVLRNGGYFFLIIYFLFAFLISFPILHLELFVSQYLRSGILKSFLLYGSGYTGFGISILLLTVANQNLAIHKGYYYLNHVIKLFGGVEDIVNCLGSSYVQDRDFCESLYNNKYCKDIDGHGNVFVDGSCKNVTGKADRIERAANVQSAMMAYIERFMLDSQLNINLSIIGFEYAFLFFCACLGVKGLRSVLIATFIFIALYFLSVVWETPPIEDVLSILRMSSNPVALFRVQTYLTAFRLSIQTYGHCVYGLFCFSSFRNRNGRSYQTAIMVFWLMMIAAALSLYTTMMFILKVNDMQLEYISTTTSISTNTIGIRFAVAALTEYTALVSMDTWGYLILSYLLFLLMDLTSVFGVIFAIFAIMRDFSPKCQGVDQRIVAFGYICCSCLFYAVFTMHLADGEKTVEESIVTYSKYFFIAIEIFIFVYAYGEHEFEVDVVEVLGEESGSIFNPTLLIFAYRHSFIAMIAMQAIECNRLSGWLQFRNLYEAWC